ncbi:MAG TPA: ATP-binding cassette domain-containing protein [Candidatus Merdibacter merdavium]|uniref:ATP-binding cassette domain-containing protein n=1 Tax=Candidatus Merdibacter merdavium TaxID=2838692 RepID=A0A9D2NPG5_9FIRM|nr:ATP-binding cassette domain-containing protein [Candidatus Merdibacter merdavium]
MSELAIEVKDVHVRYRSMKSFSLRKSLGQIRQRRDSYEALRGVSFTVPKGKIIGIIGKNGSGKSTLLKTIAGVFSPDEGTIDTFGNRLSLLAIGIGFQTTLSGYENIFLSGLLLGFTEKEIRARLPEIIEFSELGDFIYKPVQTYSSGMHSKLAFSITAFLDTEIILIDEVLSVGDMSFREKSYAKMKEIISNKDKTVMIVSHSNASILELCDDVLWIHDGLVKEYGPAAEVVENYEGFMRRYRKRHENDGKK